MQVDKKVVIGELEEMALLLELEDANPFRIRAYQNAARALETMTDDLGALIKEKRLTEIRGIGKGIAGHVTEFVTTGCVEEHEELLEKIPHGLLEMTKIPGLGPKRVKVIHRELKIETVGELEYACKENRLKDLAGFGEKSQQKVLDGIRFQKRHAGHHLISTALEDAEPLVNTIEAWKEVKRVSLTGSIRRRKEIIRDIDIVASSGVPKQVMKKFTRSKRAGEVIQHGETKSQIRLASGLSVDLRVVTDKEFPYALHHFTGSKDHNTAMRARAKKMGFKMNEYGLFKGKKLIPCKDEAEIFKKLGLAFIPPEMRENTGEIEAAEKNKIPKLVDIEDIQGVFHAHSVYSDGAHTVKEMAREAERLGYAYLGLSDHSRSAFYANGMTEAAILRQHREIDALNKAHPSFRIFKGVESDILADGALDYPDKILASFDFVIASVHSQFTMPKSQMTGRIIKAVKNKYTTMIGHLTGRLLLARSEYPLDMSEIIRAAGDQGVAIEINANPHRLDLDWRFGREARRAGLNVSINPDAHRKESLADTQYGVGIARKAWFGPDDVINTKSLKDMEKYLEL